MDNKNYLKDEQVKKNLEQYKNNKEEFLQNANVLDFDKKIILEENKENFEIFTEEKIKGTKLFIRNIIIVYLVTMVIFPILIGLFFQNLGADIFVYGAIGSDVLWYEPHVNNYYKIRIFFSIFFIFDIIFTFFMLRKNKISLRDLLLLIVITPIIYIIHRVFLTIILGKADLELAIYELLIRLLLGKVLVGYRFSSGICLGIILAKIFNKQRKNK